MSKLVWRDSNATLDAHSKTACGHYTVRLDNSNPRETRYIPVYLSALWDRGTAIRDYSSETPQGAQAVCEQHHDQLVAECLAMKPLVGIQL